MHKRHGWMMILCLIPMIAVVFFFSGKIEGFSWAWIILLLCPLMHIFMMKSMHNEDCEDSKEKPVKNSGGN